MKNSGKIKFIFLFVLSLGLIFSFVAGVAAEDQYKICYNNFGQANFFARIGRTVGINTIKMLGANPVPSVTAGVPERIEAIENCVSQNADAIIIQEGDIRQAEPALKQAEEAGLVIASMGAGQSKYNDVTVESNEWVMGAKAANYLVTDLMDGDGKIVGIHNPLGEMIRIRYQELKSVLTEYPDASIESEFVYAWPDFFPDIKNKMESTLRAHPKPGSLEGVYATFDGAGVAAASAIREAGRQEEFVIVGVDGDPQAYEEMSKPDSPFKATVAQQPWVMAETVVKKVYKLLEGEELARDHFYIPSELVTKDTLPPKSEWPYPENFENYPASE